MEIASKKLCDKRSAVFRRNRFLQRLWSFVSKYWEVEILREACRLSDRKTCCDNFSRLTSGNGTRLEYWHFTEWKKRWRGIFAQGYWLDVHGWSGGKNVPVCISSVRDCAFSERHSGVLWIIYVDWCTRAHYGTFYRKGSRRLL